MRVRTAWILIAALAPLTVASWGAFAINMAGPSPEELAADMAAIDAEIAEAKVALVQYSGGAIVSQVHVRLAVLTTTRAMLDQKRRSWLRGIDLRYYVDGAAVPRSDAATIEALLRDRDAALANAETAKSKAALYSGGAILAIILVEEQTHRATAALVGEQIAMAKLGIALPTLPATPPAVPVGQSIDDRGAL